MGFAYLRTEVIDEIKTFFLLPGTSYGDYRDGLMTRLAGKFTQGLAIHARPSQQLQSDLDALNGIKELKDGSVPLRIWLTNAKTEFSIRVEATVFDRALADMDKGPAQAADSGVIVEGIEALWELIKKDSSAYDAVVFYRNVFQKALFELDEANDYKVMHDALHDLQLNWPDVTVTHMLIQIRQFAALTRNSASLNDKVTLLYRTLAQGSVDAEERDWIDKLREVHQKLDEAIEGETKRIEIGGAINEHASEVEAAFEDVRNRLNVQLSFINDKLTDQINHLHLRDLIGGMEKLSTQLKRLGGAKQTEQLNRYVDGIHELSVLNDELSKLMREHDQWQKADSLVESLVVENSRRPDFEAPNASPVDEEETTYDDQTRLKMQASKAEEQRQARLSTLQFIVNILKREIEPLRARKTTFWSEKLKGVYQRLETKLIAKNVKEATEELSNYRDCVRWCFFDLDKELKSKCDNLKAIAESLRKVNEEMRVNYTLELV